MIKFYQFHAFSGKPEGAGSAALLFSGVVNQALHPRGRQQRLPRFQIGIAPLHLRARREKRLPETAGPATAAGPDRAQRNRGGVQPRQAVGAIDAAGEGVVQHRLHIHGDAPLREALAKCIAELYVMEAGYTAWLEQANQGAIDDFVALPEEEQTTSAKYSIGMQYLAAALEKEKKCDARMQTLEDQIRSLLTQLGGDTALVDEIHTTYMDEKAAKKTYYLSLH